MKLVAISICPSEEKVGNHDGEVDETDSTDNLVDVEPSQDHYVSAALPSL